MMGDMIHEPKRWAILLIGPPGAGKGTQAELLADDFGLHNFETSKIIEEKLAHADPKDPVMARVKKLRDSGKLSSPDVVLGWVMEKVRELAATGMGIVFSASPRTMFEAEGEVPILEELYGHDNIKVFHMNISEEESLERNSARRICKANRHPIPNTHQYEKLTVCPQDGSELVTRGVLDTPDVIRVRYRTYLEETAPVLDYLAKRGHRVIAIDGTLPITTVHDVIMQKLGESDHADHSKVPV